MPGGCWQVPNTSSWRLHCVLRGLAFNQSLKPRCAQMTCYLYAEPVQPRQPSLCLHSYLSICLVGVTSLAACLYKFGCLTAQLAHKAPHAMLDSKAAQVLRDLELQGSTGSNSNLTVIFKCKDDCVDVCSHSNMLQLQRTYNAKKSSQLLETTAPYPTTARTATCLLMVQQQCLTGWCAGAPGAGNSA
jgi:hypothetical protein